MSASHEAIQRVRDDLAGGWMSRRDDVQQLLDALDGIAADATAVLQLPELWNAATPIPIRLAVLGLCGRTLRCAQQPPAASPATTGATEGE